MKTHQTDVCIVGGGPAGMCLGIVLAWQGIRTLVVERNKDFEREFRGEILQPRFVQLMRQIGLLERVLEAPHEKVERVEIRSLGKLKGWWDVARVSSEAPFVLWMTQPHLLQALAACADECESFERWMQCKAVELHEEDGQVRGVKVERQGEAIEIQCSLVVGADGRFSSLRKLGDFELDYERHLLDVLWFQVPRPDDFRQAFNFFLSRRLVYLILPKYPDLLQCGMVLKAGSFREHRERGVEAIREELASTHPVLGEFARDLEDFKAFTLLKGQLSAAKQWAQDGCLLIGDAAHTCSPVGGIGVSMAIGTAIQAADVIRDCHQRGDFSAAALGRVQQLRGREIRKVHRIQTMVGLFIPMYRWARWIVPHGMELLSRLGVLPRMARQLLVEKRPLPLSQELRLPHLD